jgi:hypothetical protein
MVGAVEDLAREHGHGRLWVAAGDGGRTSTGSAAGWALRTRRTSVTGRVLSRRSRSSPESGCPIVELPRLSGLLIGLLRRGFRKRSPSSRFGRGSSHRSTRRVCRQPRRTLESCRQAGLTSPLRTFGGQGLLDHAAADLVCFQLLDRPRESSSNLSSAGADLRVDKHVRHLDLASSPRRSRRRSPVRIVGPHHRLTRSRRPTRNTPHRGALAQRQLTGRRRSAPGGQGCGLAPVFSSSGSSSSREHRIDLLPRQNFSTAISATAARRAAMRRGG